MASIQDTRTYTITLDQGEYDEVLAALIERRTILDNGGQISYHGLCPDSTVMRNDSHADKVRALINDLGDI